MRAWLVPVAAAATQRASDRTLIASVAPTLPSFGQPTCPSGAMPPLGVMYNHVSKTGGTSMFSVLSLAFGTDGVLVPAGNDTDTEEVWSTLAKSTPNISLMLDDCEPLQTTAHQASLLFSIATVRRPCDYYLSLWSFTSDQPENVGLPFRESANLGRTKPYTNAADIARFKAFMHEFPLNSSFSYSLADMVAYRNGASDRVHCYARTHTLFEDVQACFDHYTSACGGTIPNPLWRDEVEMLNAGGGAGQPGAACENFFSADEQATVMAREEARLTEIGFGVTLSEMGIGDHCCTTSSGSSLHVGRHNRVASSTTLAAKPCLRARA